MGRDADNYCTKAEIFEIRQRATFLCHAYQLALANMNKWTWHRCCDETCRLSNGLGMNQASFYKTVAMSNQVFRKFECFQHPNPYVQCGKRPLPRLLEVFPDAKDQIIAFGITNLAMLTIEKVHNHIICRVIPRLTKTWMQENDETTNESTSFPNDNDAAEENRVHSFLNKHGLKSMSLSTTWRWMRLLGFRYDTRRKSFYVDGHERDDVVASRKEFCKRYLTEYEPHCKRWVQLSVVEANTIKDLNLRFGYTCFNIIADEQMVEFHIDNWSRVTRNTTSSISTEGPQTEPQQLHQKQATTSVRVSLKQNQ
jgi:hypothetical protein